MTDRYLVLRTSADTARLPPRCAQWALRTDAIVDVVDPLPAGELRARLTDERCAGAVIELARVADDAALAAAIARAAFPVVAVSRATRGRGTTLVESACARVIAGRGTGGFLWALSHLHALHEHAPDTHAYGAHPANVGDLRLPHATTGRATVVLVHGGFWRDEWQRDLMDGVALDLTRRGYATWNVEYRRIGPTGGGWPQSRDDVVRAVTAVTPVGDGEIDPDRLVLLGHSAGAQLVLRAGAVLRARARPPALVVTVSGMLDLDTAAREGVGDGSVPTFLGAAPDDDPGRYRDATPVAGLPLGIRQLVVHGAADRHVPHAQSVDYYERARTAGDHVELLSLPDTDHFAVIDPASDAWTRTAAAVGRFVPPR